MWMSWSTCKSSRHCWTLGCRWCSMARLWRTQSFHGPQQATRPRRVARPLGGEIGTSSIRSQQKQRQERDQWLKVQQQMQGTARNLLVAKIHLKVRVSDIRADQMEL